jgi:predicted dehydrogenase
MSAASERITVAVVGAGEFGRNHARVYRELQDTELVGIYDSDPEKARVLAQEFHTTAFQELSDLRGSVKAVSVAVPTESHSEIGCKLLEMGIDVLVEKPMAANLPQADALIAAAKKISASCRSVTSKDSIPQ